MGGSVRVEDSYVEVASHDKSLDRDFLRLIQW
jgi:hypothetical protein